jgi:hypothetical protein
VGARYEIRVRGQFSERMRRALGEYRVHADGEQVENYWLSPKISSETMTLNGGVAFGAAIAGGAIAGPIGAFTALPVAALMSSFISNYVASYEVVYESPPPTEGQSSKSRKRKKRKKRKVGSDGNEGP